MERNHFAIFFLFFTLMLPQPGISYETTQPVLEERCREILGDNWDERESAFEAAQVTGGAANDTSKLAEHLEAVASETIARVEQAKEYLRSYGCFEKYESGTALNLECQRQYNRCNSLIKYAETQANVTMQGASWARTVLVGLVDYVQGTIFESLLGPVGGVISSFVPSVGDDIANGIGISALSSQHMGVAGEPANQPSELSVSELNAIDQADFEFDKQQQDNLQKLINGEM